MNNSKDNNMAATQKVQKGKKFHISFSTICLLIATALIVFGIMAINGAVRKGGEKALAAYNSAKEKAEQEAYEKFYGAAFASAERKSHVTNRTTINVEGAREESKLEVLRASDVEYIVMPKDKDGIEVWAKFYGEGVFTVNMLASEFLIDADRQYVLVRVPRPELTNFRITSNEPLYWDNGRLNKSYSVGVNLALEQRKMAATKLVNYMKAEANFYKSAKESAKLLIRNLVKGLNADLPNLEVEVEFID